MEAIALLTDAGEPSGVFFQMCVDGLHLKLSIYVGTSVPGVQKSVTCAIRIPTFERVGPCGMVFILLAGQTTGR